VLSVSRLYNSFFIKVKGTSSEQYPNTNYYRVIIDLILAYTEITETDKHKLVEICFIHKVMENMYVAFIPYLCLLL
jgi:hypothetical protein